MVAKYRQQFLPVLTLFKFSQRNFVFGSVSRFHGKCGGAGLISINISQQVLPILDAISVQNQN